jgi:hypothetical protein
MTADTSFAFGLSGEAAEIDAHDPVRTLFGLAEL